MKQLLEYLLSNNKKTIHENYYVLWPSDIVYNKLNEMYGNKKIESGVDYWIFSESELFDFFKHIDKDDLLNNLDVYQIPDNYNIDDVKDALLKKQLYPSTTFDRISINKLL